MLLKPDVLLRKQSLFTEFLSKQTDLRNLYKAPEISQISGIEISVPEKKISNEQRNLMKRSELNLQGAK